MSIRKPYTTQLDDIRQLFEQFKKDVECIGELKYERRRIIGILMNKAPEHLARKWHESEEAKRKADSEKNKKEFVPESFDVDTHIGRYVLANWSSTDEKEAKKLGLEYAELQYKTAMTDLVDTVIDGVPASEIFSVNQLGCKTKADEEVLIRKKISKLANIIFSSRWRLLDDEYEELKQILLHLCLSTKRLRTHKRWHK